VGRSRAATSTPAGARRAEVDEETRRFACDCRNGRPDAGGRGPDRWLGIHLRQIETGLVDFPALVSGRPIWLCWRLGEERVEWWHETTEGFDSRRRLEDLV